MIRGVMASFALACSGACSFFVLGHQRGLCTNLCASRLCIPASVPVLVVCLDDEMAVMMKWRAGKQGSEA
jgi:hypothetical protein